MGSRRDNRSSLAVGSTTALHSKHHHEKRNQELLLKRLASDTTPLHPVSQATPTPAKASSRRSVMSKSLTLELGNGKDAAGTNRMRKKSDLDTSLKWSQRQTSKTTLKMSHSLNEKEQFGDNKTGKIHDLIPLKVSKITNRKRDSVMGKSIPSSSDKKGNQFPGDGVKKPHVFERRSQQDCNKGGSRSEQGLGNRIRDRSPGKTGQKSPQERNVTSDKHQRNRKSALGDAPLRPAYGKKRNSSPVRREDNGRKPVSSQGTLGRRKTTRDEGLRGGDHDLENEKDDSMEKLERDNVPESPDKDLRDSAVGDEINENLSDGSPEVNYHCEERERGKEGIEVTSKAKSGHSAPSINVVPPNTSIMTSRKALLSGRGVQSTMKSSEGKVLLNGSKNTPKSLLDLYEPRVIDTTPAVLSKADVMEKVRQRVPNESERNAKHAVDDDKDVCETEKCDEDDFYKIKVQTRLVSYSNSTLVIKNTSKGASVGDLTAGEAEVDQATTIEPDASSHPLLLHPAVAQRSPASQTSSVPPTAAVPRSAKVEPGGRAPSLPTESRLQKREVVVEEEAAADKVEDDSVPLTRSRSVRMRLSQFVCKGKTFLTDVYSATQSKLEQYTRVDSAPDNGFVNCSRTKDDLSAVGHDNSDSGYYSIASSVETMQPGPTADDPGDALAPREGECDGRGVPVDLESPKSTSSADGRMYSPGGGVNGPGEGEPIPPDSETDKEEGGLLPSPPPPHVNFTLNEEWIKKNILCTCKCKRNAAKMAASASPSSQGNVPLRNRDVLAIEKTNCEDTGSVGVATESVATCPDDSGSRDEAELSAARDSDDLCLCSCHDGEENQQLQQLPQEVQELLDADHARMWWTITGNFGNILPIDWSKTYTRQKYLPVLNLNEAKATASPAEESERTAEDDAEEEEVAQDLDLHHLILNGLSAEPVKSAEEVIKEIDDLMQEGSSSEDEGAEEASPSGVNANEPITQPLPPPLYAEKLNNMSIGELNESFMELELVIRQYSETLINQLALRDELEYEKELKNSFISLLLQVQNKRRNFNVEKKKQKKYLTTVIPYDVGHGPPQNETLQILIKILMAINEDSPTVPTLLTDYILKVLCPS